MADRVTEALLDALLACLVFLEQAGDDVVDPYAAVTTMENATSCLAVLPPAERATIVAMIARRAAETDDPAWRAFLAQEPFAMFGPDDGGG